ncbi:ribosomal protein [Naematelia encephala]|uniref:Ribosome assembly factor mrt4 n=1 Tax=Naematelia encephala TaxID=71784 RepID=A0A1Y2AXZ9_9TREE|nr:ribosomal protein [Naematelia encephala]
MPKSKRSKVTTLSKTPIRHTKSSKVALVNQVRSEIDRYDHVWLFSVGDMRNEGLKQVRVQWRGTGRFFFGKGKVMAKALGETPETEYQTGLSMLAKRLHGPVGLFLTSHPVDETVEWFKSWSIKEYARMGGKASREILLPEGPLLTPFTEPPSGDPFPHSMEPQLRALGLSTVLNKGIPSLNNPHRLCSEGETLSSEKCRILKLLGIQMAEFRIHLGSRWSKEVGFVAGVHSAADDGEDAEMGP